MNIEEKIGFEIFNRIEKLYYILNDEKDSECKINQRLEIAKFINLVERSIKKINIMGYEITLEKLETIILTCWPFINSNIKIKKDCFKEIIEEIYNKAIEEE